MRWRTCEVAAAVCQILCDRQGQAYAETYRDQFLEVRYERLLQDPGHELNRVFSWLGEEPCAEQILQTYRESGFTIDSSRVGGWKQEHSQEHLREFDQIAGDLIGSLGYREA